MANRASALRFWVMLHALKMFVIIMRTAYTDPVASHYLKVFEEFILSLPQAIFT